MATMQKGRLRPLRVAERRELEAITKASSERVDRVKRATALLAVAGGETFSAAARAAGYRSPQAVSYLARRFNRVVAGIPVWCQDEAGPYQAIPPIRSELGPGR